MQAYQWSLIGLALDIVGVLLLSVEAIKLENIRKLRTQFLLPFHDWVKPAKIRFVASDISDESTSSTRDYGCIWWLITHAGSGTLTVILVGLLVRHRFPQTSAFILQWSSGLGKGWKVTLAILLVVLLPTLLVYVGEFWHYSLIWLTGGFVSVVDFVDRRTPDGTIGFIGVALALLGFIFQFVGTWLSRPK